MTKSYHMCITCDAAERELRKMLKKNKPQGVFKNVSYTQAFNAINEAREKGFEVVPPCENINEKGQCAGHEEREEG